MSPEYPDEPVDSFPTPPRSFVDQKGREITVREAEPDTDALLGMYNAFDPADRAQGIPPIEEPEIRDWLDGVSGADAVHVIAWHEGAAVGHAMLVFGQREGYELAIFVLSDYQGARIGTELIRSLLGLAVEAGIEKVWLTVERRNEPAVRLYRKVGFQTTDSKSFELQMTIRLG